MNVARMKTALITGITGQDGAYLTEFLLEKGYHVYGLIRRTSVPNTARLDILLGTDWRNNPHLSMIEGDLSDTISLIRAVKECLPDEIYNLGAQSFVATSFKQPEYTANVDALGSLRLLEAIRTLGLEKKTKLYQASTSELFGLVQQTPQTEDTPFYPRSPYGVAKLYAFWITKQYREAYGLFACNGILFNHESPLRGQQFVTKKIVSSLVKIKNGELGTLSLGNLEAKRDWGHARDYVCMQWQMLQNEFADDYVIATGVQYSVRQFVEKVAERLGIELTWQGTGLDEVAVDNYGKTIINIDRRFFRPSEVDTLLGDATKAFKQFNWKPTISFEELVDEMIDFEVSKNAGKI